MIPSCLGDPKFTSRKEVALNTEPCGTPAWTNDQDKDYSQCYSLESVVLGNFKMWQEVSLEHLEMCT